MGMLCKEKKRKISVIENEREGNRRNIQHISFLSQMKLHQIEKSHFDS